MDPVASNFTLLPLLPFLTATQAFLCSAFDCRPGLFIVKNIMFGGFGVCCVGSDFADVLVEAGEYGEAGGEEAAGKFGHAGGR